MSPKCMECFRMLLEHLAWIAHQFLSGIRDSRKAESLWGMMRSVGGVRVNTPQFIGQIKNFMDKDHRVSIETISAQCGNCTHNCSRGTEDVEDLREVCPRVLREDQKEWRCHDNWSIQIPQFLMLWWPAMKAGSIAMTQRPRDSVPSGSMLALPDPRRPVRENPSTKIWWSLFWQHWHDLHTLGSHWTDSQQGILCWGFKAVQEEIPSEEASTLQIGSVAFPALVHNSILVTDYLTKMGIKTVPHPPYSPDLAPCDFWLFTKLKEKSLKLIEGTSYCKVKTV